MPDGEYERFVAVQGEDGAELKVRDVKSNEFIPSITVHGPNKEKFIVPTNLAANRAYNQVTVSRLRGLLNELIEDKEKTKEMDAEGLERLSKVAKIINDISEVAYGATNDKKAPVLGDEFERFAIKTVRAAAAGAAQGARFDKWAEKLAKLGRVDKKLPEPKKAEIINIEPAPAKAEQTPEFIE